MATVDSSGATPLKATIFEGCFYAVYAVFRKLEVTSRSQLVALML
jgi:hypothetical protein